MGSHDYIWTSRELQYESKTPTVYKNNYEKSMHNDGYNCFNKKKTTLEDEKVSRICHKSVS